LRGRENVFEDEGLAGFCFLFGGAEKTRASDGGLLFVFQFDPLAAAD
jgi:hypothetical protein